MQQQEPIQNFKQASVLLNANMLCISALFYKWCDSLGYKQQFISGKKNPTQAYLYGTHISSVPAETC